MHEMALMSTAMDIVLDHAQKAGAKRVTKVFMTIGDGRDVVEDLLTGVFGHLARNTVVAGAELIVRRTPYLVRCNGCGRIYHIDVHDSSTFPRPSCGAEHDFKLVSGMEFRIESIEVSNQGLPEQSRQAEQTHSAA